MGSKEAEMPSMTADVGTVQSNLCVFTLHHFSFIFTLLFSFAQVMRRNCTTWGEVPLMLVLSANAHLQAHTDAHPAPSPHSARHL